MIRRKGAILALTSFAAVGVAAIVFADDEESKLKKTMESIQAKSSLILKNTKNAAAYAKGKKDVATAAEALIKLGKEVRDDTDAAKEQKQPQSKWTELMDAYIKEAEDFSKVAGKDDAKQADVKKAWNNVSASCSACHKIFRKDDD